MNCLYWWFAPSEAVQTSCLNLLPSQSDLVALEHSHIGQVSGWCYHWSPFTEIKHFIFELNHKNMLVHSKWSVDLLPLINVTLIDFQEH